MSPEKSLGGGQKVKSSQVMVIGGAPDASRNRDPTGGSFADVVGTRATPTSDLDSPVVADVEGS